MVTDQNNLDSNKQHKYKMITSSLLQMLNGMTSGCKLFV